MSTIKEKNEPQTLPKVAISKTTVTSSNTSTSSAKKMEKPSADLPKDLSQLVASVFSNDKTASTPTDIDAIGSNKPNTTTTTIPDWQQWWNDISKDSEVSFIFDSGIKSIMNGAYQIASQRVYDTAVRKKDSNKKPTTASTPTTSNSHRRGVNGMVHPERRSNVHQRDMSHDLYPPPPQQQPQPEYYCCRHPHHHHHNHYHHHGTEQVPSGSHYPSHGPNEYYSRGPSHGSRYESQHQKYSNGRQYDRYNYSDDDSYSYSSRGHHYHRRHDRNRHDVPYSKDDHMSAYENDHRSLASSISTKPQIAIPVNIRDMADRRHYTHDEHMDRDRHPRHPQQYRRRHRSSSDSSQSDRTKNSDRRRRHRRRSYDDDYDRDHHQRYDDYDRDRQHYRHRHDDYDNYSDDKDPDWRRRSNSEDHSKRNAIVLDATKGPHLLSSSTFHRSDRSSDSHSRSKDSRHAFDADNRYQDHGRNSQNNWDGDKHSSRRSLNDGSSRSDRRHDDRFSDHRLHRRAEFDHKKSDWKNEETLDRLHDKHNERSSNDGTDRQQRKHGKSEMDDGTGTLPITDVTTNDYDDEKEGKKRDRRYSTPSPRKSRKSKHRKSSTGSSNHKADINSGSDTSTSSTSSSPSHRRSRHHGSSSSRKHRRRENDGSDSDNNIVSSSSPRKRSGRKRRRKSRRNRSSKESGIEDKGLPKLENNGRDSREKRA